MVDIVWERVYMPLEDFNTRKGSCGDSFLTVGYSVYAQFEMNNAYYIKVRSHFILGVFKYYVITFK